MHEAVWYSDDITGLDRYVGPGDALAPVCGLTGCTDS